MRRLWKFTKWSLASIVVLVLALLAPVLYTEVACQEYATKAVYLPIITDAKYQRRAANTYLTYSEWHIVYAYEGLANTLQMGDEYQFGYFESISNFWSTNCKMNRTASLYGGADFATRSTNYVIGTSFTFEMGMKALYEDTLGWLFVKLRGPTKTPQDEVASSMAKHYAGFLQQTPWYEYPFAEARAKLWAAPLNAPLRGWERRLALGGEWSAKIGYASAIQKLVAATGAADLVIRTVVKDISAEKLLAIKNVQLVKTTNDYMIIDTPRYGEYTGILKDIAQLGGNIVEIAGNDQILITAISKPATRSQVPSAALIAEITRDGYDDNRLLLSVPILKLADVIRALQSGDTQLEHIYDY